MSTDTPIEAERAPELSVEQAKALLRDVRFTETDEGEWYWQRPGEDGYVALRAGRSVVVYVTEGDEGPVLATHLDSIDPVVFEGDDADALCEGAQHVEWRVAKDLDAVRRIVAEAAESYASDVAYANGWNDGNPDEITVTETRITVRYGGAMPPAVAGPLKSNIVDDLREHGYDYITDGSVEIEPSEDD